jgi:hypothetical protein
VRLIPRPREPARASWGWQCAAEQCSGNTAIVDVLSYKSSARHVTLGSPLVCTRCRRRSGQPLRSSRAAVRAWQATRLPGSKSCRVRPHVQPSRPAVRWLTDMFREGVLCTLSSRVMIPGNLHGSGYCRSGCGKSRLSPCMRFWNESRRPPQRLTLVTSRRTDRN